MALCAKLARVRLGASAVAFWVGLSWFSAGLLHAQAESGFALRLHAPVAAGCLDDAALTAELEARTGRIASDSDAAVRIGVRIQAAHGGYRAEVSMLGLQRELVVEGDCSELDEALVVVIASSLGISAPAPVHDHPPLTAAVPRGAPERKRDAASPPLQLEAAVTGRMLTGIMPRAAFGPGLALFAQWGALGLRFDAGFLPSTAYPMQRTLALHAMSGWVGLGLCGRAAGGSRWSALFCADVHAGAIRASLEPLRYAEPRWDALVMAVPRAEARLQLATSFGVSFAVGAAIPLIFPRYAYGSERAEAIAAHTPELGVMVELALWLKFLP